MTWLALVYIVVNALAYSALDLYRKILVREISPLPLLVWLSLGQLPFFVGWVGLAGMPAVGAGYPPYATASVVLNVAANLLFLEAVRVSPLSQTIPFLSFTPVFTALLAIPLLGEVPSMLQFAGIVLVVVGAFRLNLASGASGSPGSVWRAFTGERGSVLMIGVALFWALATPLDKLAMRDASAPLHGLVLNAGVGVVVLLVVLARRRGGELALPRGRARPMLFALVASVLGLAFLLLAINAAWVGLVETLKRAIGSLAALLLGYRFFSERITGNKLVGVLLMTAGVALVLL